MRILGISAFHRDSAAALVVDGRPVAAMHEERLTRVRMDSSFPQRAVRSCLARGGLTARDLDRVVFYEKPLRKFERVLVSLLSGFPRTAGAFSRGMFLWLGDRLWMRNRIASELEIAQEKVVFTEHHRAHGAGAFLPAPEDEAAILVVDGAGEWATTSLGRGRGAAVEVLREIHFPHSLGLTASALAQFLGFEPGLDEEKVAALAAGGSPSFAQALQALVPAAPDGSFRVSPDHFRFARDGDRLFEDRLEELLGPARRPGAPLRANGQDARDADVAASLQALLEERVLGLARALRERVDASALCFTGEVALDRGVVSALADARLFDRLYVPPDPTDAGAALGAALLAHAELTGGTACGPEETLWLGEEAAGEPADGARELATTDAVVAELARRLRAGEVCGWARGRLEMAPATLGHRCLLADPANESARERALREVRRDEAFVTAPLAVPADRVAEWFDVPAGLDWPLRHGRVFGTVTSDALRAAARADGRAPLLAVDRALDPELGALLDRFGSGGRPAALACATLAARGAPMARGETDAVDLWSRTPIDALVVDRRLYA